MVSSSSEASRSYYAAPAGRGQMGDTPPGSYSLRPGLRIPIGLLRPLSEEEVGGHPHTPGRALRPCTPPRSNSEPWVARQPYRCRRQRRHWLRPLHRLLGPWLWANGPQVALLRLAPVRKSAPGALTGLGLRGSPLLSR